MAYQPNIVPANGVVTDFSVTFPYLSKAHVKVFVDGVASAFSWVNAGTVRITPAPASGKTVTVARYTPSELYAKLKDGVPVPADTYNSLTTQAIYVAEEGTYKADIVDAQVQAAAEFAQQTEDLKDETQDIATQAAIDTAAAVADAEAAAAASAANVDLTVANVTAANTSAANALLASVSAGAYPNTYAATLPKGVTGTTSLMSGSGGTDGTFALGFSGGSITGMSGTFTVAGGLLTAVSITNPGLGSGTTPPTLDFSASAGLIGASAVAVVGSIIPAQESYWALSADGTYFQLYKNDGTATPAAVANATISGKAATDLMGALVASRTVGPVAITGTGTAVTNTSVYFWPTSLSSVDEYITSMEAGFTTAGILNVVVAHVEGDGTLTKVSEQQVSFSPGVPTQCSILKPAGSVVGVKRVSGTWYYTPGSIPNGEVDWFTSNVPTTNTSKSIGATNGPQWKATLTGEVTSKSRVAYETAISLEASVGSEAVVGWPSLVNTGSTVPGAYSVVLQTPAAQDGYITEVKAGASASGAANIHVIQYNGDLTVNVISTTAVTLANGVTTIPLSIPIAAGQYPAISGGGYKFQNSSNPQGIPAWIKSTALSNGATVTSSTQHRYEVNFTIKTGLIADTDRALSGGSENTGLSALKDADQTGSADATTAFASGFASHPYPYVRPGTFALTAIPASGDGFWGPGKPFVNGERFFIPQRPSMYNLYDGFRASMAEHIANSDVLTLIADSIGHWALASSGPAHWFNRVTRFANLGIASDEPGMTALRPSSTYTPDFYGVTTSGTVSTGTRGPLGESLILAAGASLSFTGAYEQVDVHYTQDAGQGSLAFSYNGGAAFKTVNAAGSLVLDQYSGPTLTGQAASGTYTLTASGGPVEITGLIRLGVKVAGSRPRLRTLRSAHGSYTFNNFTGAGLTAAIKQAQYAGGKIVPILALGINDSFGTDPAVIATRITTILNTLEANGVDRVFAMPPTRPSSSWNGSYTGGRTYDAALGAIRGVYRKRSSVQIIPIDAWDYINSGGYQEGLHFNDAGNDANALRFLQAVADGR